MSSTTEIASLREKLAAAEAQVEAERNLLRGAVQHAEDLAAKLCKAEADARRYRWLRWERMEVLLATFDTTDTSDVGLDAAIDAHLERGEG